MSPQDLRDLDAAFRRSPKAADTLLTKMLATDENAACRAVTLDGRSSVYKVKRVGDSLAQLDGNSARLGTMLRIAGAGPRMQRARIGHAVTPPEDSAEKVPSFDWLHQYEAPSRAGPTAQASACLRFLQANALIHANPWAARLVREHLACLILEFPALLHPRLLWDFNVKPQETFWSDAPPVVPMLHALLHAPQAQLPSPILGFTAEQLTQLACNPLLPYAVRTKAPLVQRNLAPKGSNVPQQGQSLAAMLGNQVEGRPLFASSLLHLERLCMQATECKPWLGAKEINRAGHRTLLQLSFGTTWMKEGCSKTAAAALHEEMAASRSMPAKDLRDLLLVGVHNLLDTNGSEHVDQVGRGTTAQRFARFKASLLAAGVFESGPAVCDAVMTELLSLAKQLRGYGVKTEAAFADGAYALLEHWHAGGADIDELAQRVQDGGNLHAFAQAITILKAKVTLGHMNERINASLATVDPVVPVVAAAPRRRTRLV